MMRCQVGLWRKRACDSKGQFACCSPSMWPEPLYGTVAPTIDVSYHDELRCPRVIVTPYPNLPTTCSCTAHPPHLHKPVPGNTVWPLVCVYMYLLPGRMSNANLLVCSRGRQLPPPAIRSND